VLRFNNPIGINGPRGIALSADGTRLHVVNQFTTSVSTLDVSGTPASIAVTDTTSFPGAFGSNTEQRDRRLGQVEFFTDLKGTNTSCATCHIDDHQDGLFFEADVAGPRLRRVLSLRGTRDFPPLLQDQLLPTWSPSPTSCTSSGVGRSARRARSSEAASSASRRPRARAR
jgi:DNA-binding beta-propeller fold protein YncE